jgi:hypothetical protein
MFKARQQRRGLFASRFLKSVLPQRELNAILLRFRKVRSLEHKAHAFE